MSAGPRIAIFGLHLEANAFAPPTVEQDFVELCWAEGEEITERARGNAIIPTEVPAFYERMDSYGPWEPVPLVIAAAPPGGPIEQAVFEKFTAEVTRRLSEVGPVDAVYVASHGASSATGDDDSDGTVVSLVREIVGPTVPIIVTHDLHCNVSEKLIGALDALIAYRTNPHVDKAERAEEAADLLQEVLAGTKLTRAFIRLPLVAPSVTLLTSTGPYADMIRAAEARMQSPEEGPIANVSITATFAQSDLSKCGMTVNVTTRNDQALADSLAHDLAQMAWDDRGRYVTHMIPIEEAVALAQGADAPVVFADVADNPGGGGRGNTTFMLKAMHEAGLPDAALGVFVDPALAAEAHELGEGARFTAVFNRTPSRYSERFEAEAEVVRLTNGLATGRRGVLAGRPFNLGPTALLRLAESGVLVVVGSLRRQLAEPVMLEMHGVDIAALRTLVVKSRGHFRAGFDEFFPPEQIFELDAPGLVSANFSRLDFKKLPRPVAPMDPEATWPPAA